MIVTTRDKILIAIALKKIFIESQEIHEEKKEYYKGLTDGYKDVYELIKMFDEIKEND